MKVNPFILLAGLLLCLSSSALAWPDKYDLLIKREAGRYMPGVDWRRYKAQLAVESSFRADATSPVGAAGLAQIMPGTATHLSKQLGYQIDPYNPRHAIHAGAYYMGWLRNQWKWRRPEYDRQALAESSYNAGLGSILEAQKACNNARMYAEIIKCLPQITGNHAKETLNYVQSIDREYRGLRRRH
ncbi:MAG: transglycosylase SLT domain-containing protein [Rickettsiales bacterium]